MSLYSDQFDEWNKYKRYTLLLEGGHKKKEYKYIAVDFENPQDIRSLTNEVEHLLEKGWEWGGVDFDDYRPEICLYRTESYPQEEIDMMTKWLEDNPQAKYPPTHRKRGVGDDR